ncbi:MAG TPA: glycosyltransferase, partial [Arenibaculum sp.]|nr:glycosyltransferase [Arenibaculum sp.]
RAAARSAASKVSLFLQDLHGGGAERVMLLLAGGLARRGCDVDLVLIRREGAYADSLPPGVKVVELGTGRMLNSIPALSRYLRRERPQALLTALVHVNVGALLAAALARTGTRVIVTEHNQISRNFAALGSLTLRSAYRLVPRLYRRASRIVAVSDGVADDLSRFSGIGRGRIDVVHNPIVTPELMARTTEPLDDPWFGPGPGPGPGPGEDRPPVFLGVGRLAAQKDFSTLVRAFAKVRAVRPARLLILGEGEDRADLESLVDGFGLGADIRLPGFAANPYAFMSRSAAFVLSSRFEGLPTVLVEAMACGTQVVATDCPSGPREILGEGRLGGLVPVGDADALARAMLDALARPVPAELLRGRAADFGIDRAVERYLDLITRGRP